MSTYYPLTAADDVIDFVIHVIPSAGPDKIDEADLDDYGNCIVAGKYRIAIRPGRRGPEFARNEALEIFHALDVLSDPDDYRIMVSTFTPNMDQNILQDFGAWTEKAPARRMVPSVQQRAKEGMAADQRRMA